MRSRVRWFGNIFLWFCAANFVGLIVLVGVLALIGAVEVRRWSEALSVLRGVSEAVPSGELARLRELEREETDRRGLSEQRLLEGWKALRERERRLDARAAEQRARLELLAAHVDGERRKLEQAIQTWRQERKEAELERVRREKELREAASVKIQRLYRYMRPETVARDLEARMAEGKTEEVAELVGAMSERMAAEVLECLSDPALRSKIYEAMARGGAIK